MTKTCIVVTGFMGTGKSTIGPVLAGTLGWRWLDTDTMITLKAGMSIPQIFATHGEAHFRQMERELCQSLTQETECVVSTGGGMLVDDENRRLLIESSFVVCLTAPEDMLARRLDGPSHSRPLATSWRDLLASRQPAYDQIPYQIDTAGKSPQRIAQEIITLWRSESA